VSGDRKRRLAAAHLESAVARIFAACGVPGAAAASVAAALVDADRIGLPSHGVMLVPMYVDRIRAGSVSLETTARVTRDGGAIAVLDAGHALGQLTAAQAMALAIERAQKHGLGAVAVRRAFHFGAAGRWAQQAAEAGCIGIALCNTRPLMPAPGGAEALVGNNPIAIAIPAAGDVPVVLDMALSEVAMGKVRMAQARGEAIPPGWATDARGVPTTDPAAAIAGMLLPAAGAKGFGLAFMIDLLCGVLSSGAYGSHVKPLYGDPAVPYDCAHFFLAIDCARFRPLEELRAEVEAAAARVRASKRAPGVERLYSPGEIEWQRQRDARADGDMISMSGAVLESLRATAAALDIEVAELA
jgi:LDH2 family malate/lactate/ureidoglycolate dehydrogenase